MACDNAYIQCYRQPSLSTVVSEQALGTCPKRDAPNNQALQAATKAAIRKVSAPEGGVKVEQPRRLVDPQESSHVLVVGQRGGQAHDADHALAGLHGAQRAGNLRPDGTKKETQILFCLASTVRSVRRHLTMLWHGTGVVIRVVAGRVR